MALLKRQFKGRVVASLLKCSSALAFPCSPFCSLLGKWHSLRNCRTCRRITARVAKQGWWGMQVTQTLPLLGLISSVMLALQRRYTLSVRTWGWGYCWGVQNALKSVFVCEYKHLERPGSCGPVSRLCEEVSCWRWLAMGTSGSCPLTLLTPLTVIIFLLWNPRVEVGVQKELGLAEQLPQL